MWLLEAQNLEKRGLVEPCRVAIEPAEIVGILGPRGAGKTTLLELLAGACRPDGGSIEWSGKLVTKQPMHRRARQGLVYVPREPALFSSCTVEEELASVAQPDARIGDALRAAGWPGPVGARVGGLTRAQRLHVALARAMLLEPRLLLLDEPFAGLLPGELAHLQTTLRQLRAERSISIVFTGSAVRRDLSYSDRAIILFAGRILREGPLQDLRSL
ncbi:MAG: ATP-binding cassette domain-containing protein [Planctomycetota bacterium]